MRMRFITSTTSIYTYGDTTVLDPTIGQLAITTGGITTSFNKTSSVSAAGNTVTNAAA